MITNIKMLVLDLDGTLLNSDKNIPESTIVALRALMRSGCHVVFASGRRREAVAQYVNQLYDSEFAKEWYICCDGCYVYNVDGTIVNKADLLSGKQVVDLYFDAKEVLSSFSCYTAEADYYVMRGAALLKSVIKSFLRPKKNIRSERIAPKKLGTINGIEKVVMHKKDSIFTDEECAQYAEDFNVVRMSSKRLELQRKGINKKYAVEYLRQLIGLAWSEVCFIGDDENDICMIETPCHGIVMGNATNNMKALANIVIDSNDDNGVEKFVRTQLLGGNWDGYSIEDQN